MVKVSCIKCYKEFNVTINRINTAKYCSMECRGSSQKPYWLGKKRIATWNHKPEYIEQLRKKYTGSGNPMFNKTPWNKGKECLKTTNEKNGCWKGDEASYVAKHIWIKQKLEKSFMCWNHLCENISKTYQWANISHKYKRDEDDWLMLCAKCHAIFDGRTKCQ